MSQNVYQFIGLQRTDPPKKPLKIHKIEFVEIYGPFFEGQAKAQANRCLPCGSPYYEWKCPIRNYIPDWLKLVNEGRVFEAAELPHQMNTLPEVCGRVCPQDRPCESSCTLNDGLGAVTISSIERYIDGRTSETGWCPDMSGMKQTGKKVAITDAGPTGLACANILMRDGIKTIASGRHPEIGGLLTLGIPAFKLEKEVMTRRREVFIGMGIGFRLNTEVGRDMQLDDLLSDYDAVFLGVGTYQSMHGRLENEDADGVYAVLPFLTANAKQLMGSGETRDGPPISMEDKRVMVSGGGDTAADCVHMSTHQEAKHVIYAYRRDEENMPGSRRRVKSMREEGVEFKLNVQPLGIEVSDNDKVSGIKMARTEMGRPDAKGRRRAEIVAGSEHIVSAGAMIVAFSFRSYSMEQLAKHSVELDSQRRITAPEDNDNASQTSNPKISAGDDIVCGSDLAVTAIAEGRKVVDGITSWLEI